MRFALKMFLCLFAYGKGCETKGECKNAAEDSHRDDKRFPGGHDDGYDDDNDHNADDECRHDDCDGKIR